MYWNRERERRANPYLALDPDPPAMQLDELPAQGKAQPGAFLLRRADPHLTKFLEDSLQVFRRDSDPRIADRHLDRSVNRRRANVNPPARRRELDRVRQQIQHELLDLPLVRPHIAESRVEGRLQ